MRRFDLTILGCGAAAPTPYYLTTSQIVNIHEHLILIDCGECTQLTLRKNRIKFQKIRFILISHMHADHIMGLPGLIASMNLLGRKLPLDVFGPKELEGLIKQIWFLTDTHIEFEVRFHTTNANEITEIHKSESYAITSFPTKHRVPTCGYRIKETEGFRNIKSGAKIKFGLVQHEINKLKRGEDVIRECGSVLTPDTCCSKQLQSRSYVYAADTAYSLKVVDAAKNATLLYHEATFMEKDKKIASKTLHSTSRDASKVALEANVKKMIIGHFSSRYRDLKPLLVESRELFINCELAVEGRSIVVE